MTEVALNVRERIMNMLLLTFDVVSFYRNILYSFRLKALNYCRETKIKKITLEYSKLIPPIIIFEVDSTNHNIRS